MAPASSTEVPFTAPRAARYPLAMAIERVFVAGAGPDGSRHRAGPCGDRAAGRALRAGLGEGRGGRDRIAGNLDRAVAKGRLTADERDATLARIEPTADERRAADADLVIEAVFEDIRVKSALWQELDAVAPPAAIFASNTSSIAIHRLAEAVGRAAAPGSSGCTSSARSRSCRSSS